MLRAYRAGDAPKLIAWKALARERGLLTKEFSAMASSELWLDWDEARAPNIESRLSVLAQWVIQAERLRPGLRPSHSRHRDPSQSRGAAPHALPRGAGALRRMKKAAAASPYLDVRNVMWLLAAMSFVVAPHLLRLPYWVDAFFIGIIAWRGWMAWQRDAPSVALDHGPAHVGVTIATTAEVPDDFGTRGGSDAPHRDGGAEAAGDAVRSTR